MNKVEINALTSADLYEVRLDSILSNYDYKVLVRLYQPIIGFGPISLFMTLWSEFEGDQTFSSSVNTHERVFNIMQCNTYQFIEFRKRLEAVGLLTTMVKQKGEETQYLYVLKSPITPAEFFRHPLLGILFKMNLKDYDYEKTKTLFTKVMKNDLAYEDISASFSEVYSIDKNASMIDANDYLLGKEQGLPRVTFDFDTLALALKENFISVTILTKEVKTEIASLATIYNISVMDMKGVITQSIHSKSNKRYIDIAKLRDNAHQYARTYLTIPAMKLEAEQEKEASNAGKFSDKVDMFNQLTPVEFLTLKNGGMPPIPQDVNLIDQLHSKTNLPDPVINVLLDFSLITQDNKLMQSYIMMIAGTLMRSRIQTAVDTMIYFNNLGKSDRRKKDTYYEIKKEEKLAPAPKSKPTTSESGEGLKAFLDFAKVGDKNGES